MEDKVAALRFILSTAEKPTKDIDDSEWMKDLAIHGAVVKEMEDDKKGVWIVVKKEDMKWVERDGFRFYVSEGQAKDFFEGGPFKTRTEYKFAPIPKIVGDFWLTDLKAWKYEKIWKIVRNKFKKMRNR